MSGPRVLPVRPTKYDLPRAAGAVLLGLGLLSAPGCHRGSAARSQPLAATLLTQPAPASAAEPGPRSKDATTLTRVPQEDWPSLPTLFDPSGRYMAVVSLGGSTDW